MFNLGNRHLWTRREQNNKTTTHGERFQKGTREKPLSHRQQTRNRHLLLPQGECAGHWYAVIEGSVLLHESDEARARIKKEEQTARKELQRVRSFVVIAFFQRFLSFPLS